MNAIAPFYLCFNYVKTGEYCLLRFYDLDSARRGLELLNCNDVYDEARTEMRQPAWAASFTWSELVSLEEKLKNVNYNNAVIVLWQDVLCGKFLPVSK